jgi:hypothetical protein
MNIVNVILKMNIVDVLLKINIVDVLLKMNIGNIVDVLLKMNIVNVLPQNNNRTTVGLLDMSIVLILFKTTFRRLRGLGVGLASSIGP